MVSFSDLFFAFTYGLSSSLTLCLASCLPVYLPILFGYGDDAKKGFKLSLGFAIGRFLGYITLGMIAAALGAAFFHFFNNIFPKVSTWLIFIFGILTIFYGTLILAKAEFKMFHKKSCKSYLKNTNKANNPFFAAGFLGYISTITPCVPVFTFLLLPFALGKIFDTTLLTVAFGLGANVVFIVIGVMVAVGMKNVQNNFHQWKRRLEVVSGVILIIFGFFYIIWVLGPLLFHWQYNNFVLPTAFDFIDFLKSFF